MTDKLKDLIEYAKTLGINLKYDPSLDKYSGKPMFPEQVKAANEMVSRLKITHK
ncbi:hypothetical protein SAMN05421788_10837 [Filimonas lacunae]|uniref:Uncharacterized protein n=1 Tax=Filimonas lacunae TaxID=477680 RepID=A0A1N7R1A7_9BACT|nr:hypothetical protein [Filimonas lacunae]SIT28487.1 hypothetical protein SAMN05421788_10837 [Filimonas lacunae]